MLEEYKTKPLPKNILEPSAGKGDIIDYISKIQAKRKAKSSIYAIEFVPELQEILKQKLLSEQQSKFGEQQSTSTYRDFEIFVKMNLFAKK